MTTPGHEPLAVVERAIIRRIESRGPQNRLGVLDLPWCQTKVYRALQRLKARQVVHISRRVPSPAGGRTSHYWGIVGVHPYAPSAREQVLAYVERHGPSWPQHIGTALGLHETTVVTHCRTLVATGKIERVEGRQRRVLYRLVTAGRGQA